MRKEMNKKIAGVIVISLGAFCVTKLYAQVNPQITQGCQQILLNVGTAIDQLTAKLSPFDQGGTFTAIQAAQNTANTISSKIDALNLLVVTDFSGTWTAINNLQNTDNTISSKVSILQVDFQQTWTLIGNTSDVSTSSASFTTAASIDSANLNVIEWLKTIFRAQKGL
jgi:hypothetical protein